MSHDHDMSVTQMYWQPPMLRLTYVAHPEVDGHEPTTCFVCPQLISGIGRQALCFGKADANFKGEFHPVVMVTGVALTTGQLYYVVETPEQVATLRDKALGHEPPKPNRPLSPVEKIFSDK